MWWIFTCTPTYQERKKFLRQGMWSQREIPRNQYEPRCEKTSLLGFRPGPTQTRMYSDRRWLDAENFVSRKKRECSIPVAKTMALISFAVTAKLICVFILAYAKSRYSHNEAHIISCFHFFPGKERRTTCQDRSQGGCSVLYLA